MSVTGHAETGPTRTAFALSDTIGGMTAALAIASALDAQLGNLSPSGKVTGHLLCAGTATPRWSCSPSP